ncbi:MAG TPA: zinc-ribbon domain-containing protein [Candidatus Deferrimicrobiaceae bacterium]
MIIRCGRCESRFRLDQSLIQGYRGARIRCRSCGHPIVVSIPVDPPGTLFQVPAAAPAPSRERAFLSTRTEGTAALVEPAAEGTPAPEVPPDNLVDLLRYRGSNRPWTMSGNQDISGRISPEIPVAVFRHSGNAPGVPPEEDSPPQASGVSGWNGLGLTLEDGFLWREPSPRKKSAVYPAVKFTLLFTLAGTAALYLVFHLFLAIAAWTVG